MPRSLVWRFAAELGFVNQDASRSILIRRANNTDCAAPVPKPPRSKTATRRPASCHRPRSRPEKYPLRGERFSPVGENSRSEIRPRQRRRVARGRSPSREAVARGRAEAARCGIMRKFAGRSCAASSLSSDKGATPAGGGKPSAADSEQTCLTRNCRARFWAASPPALPPTSREIR